MDIASGDLELAQVIANWIETFAVVIIGVAAIGAFVRGVVQGMVRRGDAFDTFKRTLARGLLIGLDLLIAGDIITTVTVDQTLENVLALGLLVVIRTFLSWTLLLDMEGRWPWHRGDKPAKEG